MVRSIYWDLRELVGPLGVRMVDAFIKNLSNSLGKWPEWRDSQSDREMEYQ